MRIRLNGEQVRRLKALVATHDEINTVAQALDAAIVYASHESYEDGRKVLEEHDAARIAAWEKRKADARTRQGPPRRTRRPKSKISPAVREAKGRAAPVLGGRRPPPSRVKAAPAEPLVYEHKPAPKAKAKSSKKKAGGDAAEGKSTQ